MNISSLYLVISAGLLDSFNPCAIAILLIFIALMLTLKKTRRQMLLLAFAYILAVFVAYFAIGVGLMQTIHLFSIPKIATQIVGWLVVIWGVWAIKDYFFPKLPLSLSISLPGRQIIANFAEKATLPATLVMGFLVAIFGFPCTGGIYLATLALLSVKETYLKGIAFLCVYNLMFVLPLVVILLVTQNRFVAEKLINLNEKNSPLFRLIIGLITLAMGLVLVLYLTR